jgi:hypothetical protein
MNYMGIEPTACGSESERATHYTTAPHIYLLSYYKYVGLAKFIKGSRSTTTKNVSDFVHFVCDCKQLKVHKIWYIITSSMSITYPCRIISLLGLHNSIS